MKEVVWRRWSNVDRREQVNDDSSHGFTLVEVTLAMVFIAIIIAVLAATTVNIIRSYNKGVWLSQINQAGQQLNTDIGEKARYSTMAKVFEDNQRICVGGVTYLWNTENQNNGGTPPNTFTNGGHFSLVRIDDISGEYCSNPSKMPDYNDPNVQVLLGTGATIQQFDATHGVASPDSSGNSIPLLSLEVVISTKGANKPVKAEIADDGTVSFDPNNTNDAATWQCGEWIDRNHNNIADDGDGFTPAENQFCSFAEYNITVYERSRQQ